MAIKDLLIRNNDTIDDKDIWEVTPWQKDNPSAITKSSVEKQDELTLEDYLDGDSNAEIASSLEEQFAQLGTQNGIYTAVKKIKNAIKSEETTSERPSGTVEQTDDEIGVKLQKIKNNKLKRVKLSSKFGLYNTYMNLLGNAAGLFIGSLGKTTATQIADYALSKTKVSDLTLGLGTDSIRRIVKAAMDEGSKKGKFSSVDIPYEDIIDLNISNFFTIYSSRPGLTVRSTNNLLQYVASDEGKLDKLLNAAGSSASKLAGNLGIKLDAGKLSKDDKSSIDLISLEQLNDFEDKNTFLISETDANDKLKKIELPSNVDDTDNIGRGIIPQNFDIVETEDYKENLKRSTKAALEAFNNRNFDEAEKIYNEAREKGKNAEELKQQRTEYVKNTIIHSKARIDDGVEVGSLKDYVKKRYDYLKEALGDRFNIYYEENGKNLPMLMRELNENERSNGGLYIEPFYGVEQDSNISSFFIPFEFNPEIQEGSSKAEYTKERILGRILPLRAYISTDSGDLTITTKYLALEGDIVSVDGLSTDFTKYWTDDWQRYFSWDLKKIQYLEGLYRSLTLPYIKEAKFVRPPIIRVIPPCHNSNQYKNSSETNNEFSVVSDLYSYPNYNGKNDEEFKITKIFDDEEYNNRIKRYVATDVQVSPIDENGWGNNFTFDSTGSCVRKGFKVTVTLAETTKNFLDTIPTFASYVGNKLNEKLLVEDESKVGYRWVERIITPQDNLMSREVIEAINGDQKLDLSNLEISYIKDGDIQQAEITAEPGDSGITIKSEKSEEIKEGVGSERGMSEKPNKL